MLVVLEHNYPDAVEDIVANHLRVQLSDGELYTSAVQCVRNAFDIAEEYCNRVITPCEISFTANVDGGVAQLPTAPIRRIVSVESNGKTVGYRLISNDKAAYLADIPSDIPSVEVMAEAGFSGELPGSIYAAVVIIASSLFEDGASAELSPRAKSLLNPYRISPYGL